MKIKTILFTLILALFICVYPTVAAAGTDQAGQTPVGEIKDYTPPEVSFHSLGHIQRWNNSPLSAQNPHLWTAMFLTMLVGGGVLTTLFIKKKRREHRINPQDSFGQYRSELKTREARLHMKFQEADRRYRAGEVSEADFKRFLRSHEENLAKIRGRIEEMERLKEREDET